ncbi:hypothetical protein BGW36DRAFT_383389 [Talaromyces proteolyticus]|uniref:Uncharacterized protein n=1 Tax=Talaromyces proteolyticus TaxID=1131652 RepID=A0AAD4KQ29_9EURO|nr:uncharacterized protein BGW36DRAFT_383389 [Talaromyces proteolyticus]KAH8693629.1 hypothetical protein BGW36DRAFT_383389 [Talaromyces proteolyticus]
MASSGPNPVPPTHILSSRSIPQSAALDFLTAYLDRAANDPSLQPSAMITEHGPISRTTAAAPNLTLHNLKRVQAGLAGETLGRDLTLSTGVQPKAVEKSDEPSDEQWEDRKKWELEAGEGVEKDRSDDFIDNATEQVDVDEEGMPLDTPIDKEERKRRKKERRKGRRRRESKRIRIALRTC